MNTNVLSSSALILAFAAIALIPVSATAAGAAITVAGVLSVLLLDYGRTIDPVRVQAGIVPFNAPAQSYRRAA